MSKQTQLYSLSQLNSIASGNDAFVIKLVNMFLEKTPNIVNRIELGIKNQDWQEVRSASHKMKPSIDMMGIEVLYNIVRSIEHNAKMETNLEQIPALFEELKTTLADVFEQLRNDVLN